MSFVVMLVSLSQHHDKKTGAYGYTLDCLLLARDTVGQPVGCLTPFLRNIRLYCAY